MQNDTVKDLQTKVEILERLLAEYKDRYESALEVIEGLQEQKESLGYQLIESNEQYDN